ncbi:MAG: NAD-binding protein [Actinomycetota bacterium]|nr:NAD-binding protein [Actinomycetota bacterium]
MLSSLSAPLRRWNVRVVLWLVVALVVMVVVYSVVFHQLMALEGRSFSWPTSVYWTLTVMSTLGFGDITFKTDAGRIFSIIVLGTGALFILVLLPFAFIQFIFMPWMAQREATRAPRRLPDDVSDHLIFTKLDAVADALVRRARRAGIPYVLIVPDLNEALRLHDEGHRVMVGELDDPATYRAARVDQAALVASTQRDTTSTNIAFTIRELNETVPIAAIASSAASVDILELAGCDKVLQLGQLLGQALARRILGGDLRSHVIGEFGNLRIAEADVRGTPLVGRTLREVGLRQRCNVSVVGVWERGKFSPPTPQTLISDQMVLILAGSDEQLASYNALFAIERQLQSPVVILGGGRVGRAAGDALDAAGVAYTIVEQRSERIRSDRHYIEGDAAELEVLHRAGINEASAALVTTHDDDMNVYLALYCRRLRPDMQIIARATLDRNVPTLHRAGADAVLSYASIGATAIWNILGHSHTLVVAEGLNVFRVPMPPALTGRSLVDSAIEARTGCNVVAVCHGDDIQTNPDPTRPLPADAELIVIGDEDSERQFLERFPATHR